MEQYQLFIFVANIPLILIDAALGYHMAPRLLSGYEEELAQSVLQSTRSLLAAVVALYMFCNCLGYFQGNTLYLLIVTGLVLGDMGLQYWLVRRNDARKGNGPDKGDTP
ncbi:MAG: hypothetical protein HY888_04010 [Deltaproteobacteria bacterium]|nr:hypothetical protein [Deltaproteobacteria bacterium]